MGSRWKNKGQGGGVSWGNKEKKSSQQSKKKAEPTLLSEAAAAAQKAGGGYAGQLAKGNLASAQPKATGALGGSDVLSALVTNTSTASTARFPGLLLRDCLWLQVQDQGVAKALWRVRTDTVAGPKILCLHGYTQNGSIFKKKLAGLEKFVKQQWYHTTNLQRSSFPGVPL